MRLKSFMRRRPSPAMGVALAALFVSLGGVGYAASTLPSGSVGTAQLQNDAVSYQKIQPNSVGKVRLANGGVINSKLAKNSVSFDDIQQGAVGTRRANLNQLQARVFKTCGAGTAIGAIDKAGNPTCNAALPSEFGASNATPVALTSSNATVTTVNLPAGSAYFATANPTISVTGDNGRVTATCTMTVGAATQTRTVTLATGSAGATQTTSESIPLQLAGAAGTSSVACLTDAPSGTTTASAAINALQTASNS